MRHHSSSLLLSASDLSRFLGCRHRTGLDLAVLHGKLKRPFYDDPHLDLLKQRGIEHEAAYVDLLRKAGHTVVDVRDHGKLDDRVSATHAAMRDGADVIVQGALLHEMWHGYPDIMQRVSRPSALGQWSYEIADTKLARETKAGTILQLSLYSALLAQAQGTEPEKFQVVVPSANGPVVESYRVLDYSAYFRFVQREMLRTLALGDDVIRSEFYPEPVDHCDICEFGEMCRDRRREDDHLSFVAGITRSQRRELESRSVTTLESLATLPLPISFKPSRGSKQSYERVREQARIQKESRGLDVPLHELLAAKAGDGFSRLPEPTEGDLFLDLEGDAFAAEGGREYLFGVVMADGSYHSKWGMNEQDERAAFEWFMDLVASQLAKYPDMHVYHYAPYEPSAFKRLMGRYATREDELDAMLRSGRFVDLYAVVRQGLRAGVERYSIKCIEPLYGYKRDVELSDARKAITALECALEAGNADLLPAETRAEVEGYNRDDCVSTLRLRDWLERLRAQLIAGGADVPRPVSEIGDASESVSERAQQVAELRSKILKDVAAERSARTEEQQARWLLAYMLDYHRREEKSTWWEFFRLCKLTEEDLHDEREAVAGLEFVERVDLVKYKNGNPRSAVDRYRYPVQEMEITAGCKVKLQDGSSIGTVKHVDTIYRTIDLAKGKNHIDIHPTALFAFDHVPSEQLADSLMRIGERVAGGISSDRAAMSLLTRECPRLRAGEFKQNGEESATEFAVRIAGELDGCVLPIQGPPGAGKTFTGARMICELIRQGRKVGVTANSHAVIRNLLEAVVKAAGELDVPVRAAHKGGDDNGAVAANDAAAIRTFTDNNDALDALRNCEVNVLGGTAWLWSRPEAERVVDVLFVDEAGQMALANVVAVSPAAESIVLLGDPQQLEQPRKGSHPDGVGVSALQHLLGDNLTIPAERGIFLPETWRMVPRICEFTSEVFYEGRLTSRPMLSNQCLTGVSGLPAHGLFRLHVFHEGNRNYSIEEIDEIENLVNRLTSGVKWVNSEGESSAVKGSDILVVAPYNAHVMRLRERLEKRGVRVGTVDKFQGQEAPVVIYSMATSSPEDAPRGMEFLYSLNRLNVATSRARCLAVLVANPRLFEVECRTPRQMRLANAMARFVEHCTQNTQN